MAETKAGRSIFKSIIKWTFRSLGVLFVAALVYFSPNIYHIYKWNPVITPMLSKLYGEAGTKEQARLEDIEFLRKLPDIDRSFTEASLEAFKSELDTLEERVADISDAEFSLAIAHAVANSDNGHTNISQRGLIAKNNRLPIRTYWFDGHLHIVRSHPDYADLLGAEVLAFGQTPVQAALTEANQYFGGPKNWRTYMSTTILESPALAHAAGIADSPEKTSLRVLRTDGSEETIELPALDAEPDSSFSGIFPWMVQTRQAYPGEQVDWVTVADDWQTAPLYLSRADTPFFFEEMMDGKGLYIHVSFMLNLRDHNIYQFWERVSAHLEGKHYDAIVLDFRNNPGGDFNSSVATVKTLPNHLTDDGKLFVATSSATFSAAIVNTSVAKYYGGNKTIIIGERVGDRDQFWAEGGFPFRLPHSDYAISFATGYHDWVNGCTGKHPYCYDGNANIENPINSLDPDVPVVHTFKDFSAGLDPVIEKVKQITSLH